MCISVLKDRLKSVFQTAFKFNKLNYAVCEACLFGRWLGISVIGWECVRFAIFLRRVV
nr:MAG TPA: hypothetical protein [Caudoviricetes sp.]